MTLETALLLATLNPQWIETRVGDMGFLQAGETYAYETISPTADITLIDTWGGKAATVIDFEIDETPVSIGEGLDSRE